MKKEDSRIGKQPLFDSPEHVGPSHIAEFLELSDTDEVDRIKRDAYERVLYLAENS